MGVIIGIPNQVVNRNSEQIEGSFANSAPMRVARYQFSECANVAYGKPDLPLWAATLAWQHCVKTHINEAMQQDQKQLLGQRLKAARGQAKLSQAFVGESLGVTRQAVAAWESGASCPSAIQLAQLATAYCVCTHALLFGVPYEAVNLGNYAKARA